MLDVIPAILPKNYEDLKDKIALVRGLVPLVQVDICDGVYVPSMTWPFLSPSKDDGVSGGELDQHFVNIIQEREGMPFWEDVDFELDLMVHDAVTNFDIYTKLGPKRILFHLESVGNLDDFKEFIEGIDPYTRDSIEIGVAIKPSTSLEHIYNLENLIDRVQIMGNDKIGYQGVTLDESVYEKVRTLRAKYPDMPISVDIGVNMETAPLLVEAGVNKVVSGSAILTADDIIGRIEYFKNLGN